MCFSDSFASAKICPLYLLRIWRHVWTINHLLYHHLPSAFPLTCRYSPSMKSLGNKFMHLTNYSVNKKNAEYQANEDETACQGHKWYPDSVPIKWRPAGIQGSRVWGGFRGVVNGRSNIKPKDYII